MQNLKILSLEDDANLSMVMKHYLEDEGAQLKQATTGQNGLSILGSWVPDVVLLDLGLPDIDGLTLLPQIKAIYNGPIIVLSGKTSTTDRIVGLEMGADDYLIKPFEMRELTARIKANTRRIQSIDANDGAQQHATMPAVEDCVFEFGDYIYNPKTLSLSSNDGVIELTTGELQLLQLFIDSNGRALTREYLYEQIHGDALEAFDRSVDIQITRLRKKLNDDPSQPKYIKTVRGIGYIFIQDIKKQMNAA